MLEDKLITRKIRNGNNQVFEKVFHDHYYSLVKFANQILADVKASEDVVQATFIYLWENSKAIELKTSIKSYLYQAVKNGCLNQLRALKLRDKHELLYLEAVLSVEDDKLLQDLEILKDIRVALSKLPPQMYQVFYKKYFQELTIKEIAQELSISPNTVKVQLHKGRHSIREILDVATSFFFLF